MRLRRSRKAEEAEPAPERDPAVARSRAARRSPAALTRYLGLAFALAGFTAIGLAWNGAAEVDRIQGQFPFFVSGGLTGLGLVFVGAMLLVIEALRRDGAAQIDEVRRLTATIEQLHASLAPAEAHDPLATGEFRPRPRVSANGGAMDETRPLPPPGGREHTDD